MEKKKRKKKNKANVREIQKSAIMAKSDWAFFPITTQDFGLLQLYVYRKKIQITVGIN